jgi:hypothetical protein
MSAMSSPILRTGALSGLDNAARLEVANTMSKFVRRGAARALPLSTPEVGVTVINPGNATTAEVEADLLAAINSMLRTSAATTVAEIDLHQRRAA